MLDSMWKLLFSIYNQGVVQVDECHAAELIESLLLLLNPKDEEPMNNLVREVIVYIAIDYILC